MNFIQWFKQSLEDEKGQASFKRITNYILLVLICFEVIYPIVRRELNIYFVYILIVLVATLLINTGVITWENLTKMASVVKGSPYTEEDGNDAIKKLQADITINPKP